MPTPIADQHAEQLLNSADPADWGPGLAGAAEIRRSRALNASLHSPGADPDTWRTGTKVAKNLYRGFRRGDDIGRLDTPEHGVHAAAAGSPRLSVLAAQHWANVADRHSRHNHRPICVRDGWSWPCPDLTECRDEALAYLASTTTPDPR